MPDSLNLKLHISPDRAGSYFTLPFTMPPDTASVTISYSYERHHKTPTQLPGGRFTSRQEINIIDIGLLDPAGAQVGASGSDKTEFTLSETWATPGYHPWLLAPGEWRILVGAYKVAPQGVDVTYEIIFTPKRLRLLKGDPHTHTVASDGVLTAEELGWKALRHGLDYIAITNHNQQVSAEALPVIPGLTIIPGVEWTHYRGHASFLGVAHPYDSPFFTNTEAEARAIFESAHARGAVITANHPLQEGVEFKFDFDSLPVDCLEIWNGPMRESNLKAVGLWHAWLSAGKKVPACGGSDYHRDTPFIILGGPTTCVYALSAGPSDILAALKQGHAFITYAPDGPMVDLHAGQAILGDTVSWSRQKELHISAEGLLPGDVLRVVTARSAEPILQAPTEGAFEAVYPMPAPGFARLEILRAFLPGLPLLPALISNPIYFE